MIPYFFLIATPALLALFPSQKAFNLRILLWFTGIIYVIFIAFRYEVGADWEAYLDMYDYISSSPFQDGIQHTEPGFALLNWIMAQLDTDVYGVNFIAAILLVLGLIKFAEKMPSPWLALVSVTSYLVVAIGMSAVRQSVAVGLVFYLLADWRENSTVKNIVVSLLAIAFHYSAFIALLFVLQGVKMPRWCRWIILLVGGAVSFVIFTQTEQYATYEERYVIRNVESSGALQHVLLSVIPAAIYLFFRKKWHRIYGKNDLMQLLAYLSLLSLVGISFSSTSVDRLALYLSPIQMYVYGTMPTVFRNLFYAVAIVVIHVIILYVWLAYSNTSITFMPYQNILFNF